MVTRSYRGGPLNFVSLFFFGITAFQWIPFDTLPDSLTSCFSPNHYMVNGHRFRTEMSKMSTDGYLSYIQLNRMCPSVTLHAQCLAVGTLPRNASSALVPLGGQAEEPVELALNFLPCFAVAIIVCKVYSAFQWTENLECIWHGIHHFLTIPCAVWFLWIHKKSPNVSQIVLTSSREEPLF